MTVPPNDSQAERAVLGSMLISRQAAELCLRRLVPEDFYQDTLRAVFQAMLTLRTDFPDSPIDIVTVGSKVKGGQSLLAECHDAVGTSHHAEHYAKIVKDMSLHRKILANASTINEDPSQENIKKLEELAVARRANRGKNLFRFKEDLGPMMDEILRATTPGIETGLYWFDQATSSHLHPEDGELWTIGSRPGGGKTALLVKLACSFAQRGTDTLIFTSEMRTKAVVQRILSGASRVHHKKIRLASFEKADRAKLVDAWSALTEYPITIAEYGNPTIGDLMGAVYEAKPKVVVIDYLQRFKMPKAENMAYAIGEFMRQLKTFLLDEGIVGFIGAQTARDLDRNPTERPTMSCLRGSAGIEHESTGVVLLWEPSGKAISRMTEWIEPTSSNRGIVGIFAKNRDNKAGHEAQLQLDGDLIDLIERLPVGDDPRAERDAEQGDMP
jgi:replicative DNA helicase